MYKASNFQGNPKIPLLLIQNIIKKSASNQMFIFTFQKIVIHSKTHTMKIEYEEGFQFRFYNN